MVTFGRWVLFYTICHRIDTYRCLGTNQVSNLGYRWKQQLIFALSIPGESPPPPPGVFYGRTEWIERIVDFAEHLASIALIGVGGIGKTSIALTVLHDDRIKRRFGDDRRFIRCDKFTISLANFLSRLSKVIGAGVENPDDLAPLRPFLSSKEIIIVLDNAESILDPQGTDAQEIYAAVEELSQFDNICLCITSRITTIPPDCETLDIPTLSMGAALDTFYRIHRKAERSDPVHNILEQLDFHPLSITLLATVACHNKWNTSRLIREWDRRRTAVLHTKHNKSLAATIELSLSSPMFQELGPDARDLLGIIAFFPQGINEDNLDWLFPTTSNRTDIFDTFCILSLTYQSNGFVTMLAPLRDHLYPKDPRSTPLLCTIKEHYFSRLSIEIYPGKPGYDEAQWIISEDANVEHLLDTFTSTNGNSDEAWGACYHFIEHLVWYKPRLVALGPKIKALPDDHPSKPKCLSQLASLFHGVGNFVEPRQLLTLTLKIWREQGNEFWVAETLRRISRSNQMLDLNKEATQQLKEALGIYEQLDDISGQARTLRQLAYLLIADGQLGAAEGAALQVIDHFPGEQFSVCQCYCALGEIYHSKGEVEKAIAHLNMALGVASSFNWDNQLFWIHYRLAEVFFTKGRLDDAHTHIECAKSNAVNNTYRLNRAVGQQAWIWYRQQRFEEARSAASHAADVFERLGATKDTERYRALLRDIEQAAKH
jgi:tetratricopeptide (TPR) repeat protein